MKKMKKILMYLLCFSVMVGTTWAEEAEAYDKDQPGFNPVLADADPTDVGTVADDGDDVSEVQTVIDSNGVIYSAYIQSLSGGTSLLYVNRLKDDVVETWDVDNTEWTTVLTDGDAISAGAGDVNGIEMAVASDDEIIIVYTQYLTASTTDRLYATTYSDADGMNIDTTEIDALGEDVIDFGIAIDSDDNIYYAFIQSDSANDRLFLVRYNNTNDAHEVWDIDGGNVWKTDLTQGDPIDVLAEHAAALTIAAGKDDVIYIGYQQTDANAAVERIYGLSHDGITLTNWAGALDTASGTDATKPRMVVDPISGVVYGTMLIDDGDVRLHLIKYDPVADEASTFLDSTGLWSTDLTLGEPIDNETADVSEHELVMSGRDLYIASTENNRIYLTKYDFSELDLVVWDNDTSAFLNLDPGNASVGDPIDAAKSNAGNPKIAVDYAGRVYITYTQGISGAKDLYISRFDGKDVKVWDNTNEIWTDTFSDGSNISAGATTGTVSSQTLVINGNGVVYLSYNNEDAVGETRLYTGAQGIGRKRPSSKAAGRRKSKSKCLITSEGNLALMMLIIGTFLLIPFIRTQAKV